jgi:hypothetical protein
MPVRDARRKPPPASPRWRERMHDGRRAFEQRDPNCRRRAPAPWVPSRSGRSAARSAATPFKASAWPNSLRFSSDGSGVLDHRRYALPAPRPTATMLFHAERASASSRTSSSEAPTCRSGGPERPACDARPRRPPPPRERRTEDEGGRQAWRAHRRRPPPGQAAAGLGSRQRGGTGAGPKISSRETGKVPWAISENLSRKARNWALAASVRSGPFHAAEFLDDCTQLVHLPAVRCFSADANEASRALGAVVLPKSAALKIRQIGGKRQGLVGGKRAEQPGRVRDAELVRPPRRGRLRRGGQAAPAATPSGLLVRTLQGSVGRGQLRAIRRAGRPGGWGEPRVRSRRRRCAHERLRVRRNGRQLARRRW